MRRIEGFVVAPHMQDRGLKTLVAQEFQTTIVGMLGHDLRQSLQVIQGTYALLRSRLEQMPEQAWLDRGERAVTKLNAPMRWRSPRSELGLCSGGSDTKTKMPPFKGLSIFEQ